MEIVDIKDRLNETDALRLIAYCQYNPTLEKVKMLADTYSNEILVSALGCVLNDKIVGLIILRCKGIDKFEILAIATDPKLRGKGIAKSLLKAALKRFPNSNFEAETDDQGVFFYYGCNFVVESLGEKYPGIVRYRCTRKS